MVYLFRNTILFVISLVFISFQTFGDLGQFPNDSYGLKEKIEFINQLTEYIRNDFELVTGDNFYTLHQPGDKPAYFVYVSSPDSVYCSKPFRSFGTDENAAIECQKKFDNEGFHTLLYHTAGTAAAKLNSLLLSYRFETISFILFHEAMHRHLMNKGATIPYEIVESVCDVIGNYGTIQASKKFTKIKKRTVRNQLKTNENIYAAINKHEFNLQKIPEKAGRDSIFTLCRKEIEELLGKGDAFQRDRFSYTINNAYFVRNRDYAQNYFLLRDVFLKTKNTKKFLDIIDSLPEKTALAKKALLEKL